MLVYIYIKDRTSEKIERTTTLSYMEAHIPNKNMPLDQMGNIVLQLHTSCSGFSYWWPSFIYRFMISPLLPWCYKVLVGHLFFLLCLLTSQYYGGIISLVLWCIWAKVLRDLVLNQSFYNALLLVVFFSCNLQHYLQSINLP